MIKIYLSNKIYCIAGEDVKCGDLLYFNPKNGRVYKIKNSKGKVVMITKLGKHKGKFLIGSKGK